MSTESSLEMRARVHAALGDPSRLAIVDALTLGDASPGEIGALLGMPTNLVAHHVKVLHEAGLVVRTRSEGDRRRTYLRLDPRVLASLTPPALQAGERVVFVCTHNSARSQLAAALWRDRVGGPVASAGTKPAARVHPRAVKVAHRHGLALDPAGTAFVGDVVGDGDLVIAVCDNAHEDLTGGVPAPAALVDPGPGPGRYRRGVRGRLHRPGRPHHPARSPGRGHEPTLTTRHAAPRTAVRVDDAEKNRSPFHAPHRLMASPARRVRRHRTAGHRGGRLRDHGRDLVPARYRPAVDGELGRDRVRPRRADPDLRAGLRRPLQPGRLGRRLVPRPPHRRRPDRHRPRRVHPRADRRRDRRIRPGEPDVRPRPGDLLRQGPQRTAPVGSGRWSRPPVCSC